MNMNRPANPRRHQPWEDQAGHEDAEIDRPVLCASPLTACAFCGEQGHFIRRCPHSHAYIRSGLIIRGPDKHLYLPDGHRIPHVSGCIYIQASLERLGIFLSSTSTNHFRTPDRPATAKTRPVTPLVARRPTTSLPFPPSILADPSFQLYLTKARSDY